jgi:hypothetical protein
MLTSTLAWPLVLPRGTGGNGEGGEGGEGGGDPIGQIIWECESPNTSCVLVCGGAPSTLTTLTTLTTFAPSGSREPLRRNRSGGTAPCRIRVAAGRREPCGVRDLHVEPTGERVADAAADGTGDNRSPRIQSAEPEGAAFGAPLAAAWDGAVARRRAGPQLGTVEAIQ